MITLRKSYLKRIGAAGVIAGIVLAAAANVASATGNTVTIDTPKLGDIDVYFDANGNGIQEANEYVGKFPAYPGTGLSFHWPAYNFPAGVNGSYYVTLWQNTTPLDKNPTWVMRKAGHDFADNPAGTQYLMGPFFDYENICELCPSMLVVQLEAYQHIDDDILYFPFSASLTAGGKPSGFATSDEFVLEGVPGPEHKSAPGCSSPNDSQACCKKLEPGWDWNTDTNTCQEPIG